MKISILLLITVLAQFTQAAPNVITDNNKPTIISDIVTDNEGVTSIHVSTPLKKTSYTRRITLKGIVGLKNKEDLEITKTKRNEIGFFMIDQLRGLELNDLANREFKKDLTAILEEEIGRILNKEDLILIQKVKVVMN